MTQLPLLAGYDANKITARTIKPCDTIIRKGRRFTVITVDDEWIRCVAHDSGMDAMFRHTEIDVHFSR